MWGWEVRERRMEWDMAAADVAGRRWLEMRGGGVGGETGCWESKGEGMEGGRWALGIEAHGPYS